MSSLGDSSAVPLYHNIDAHNSDASKQCHCGLGIHLLEETGRRIVIIGSRT